MAGNLYKTQDDAIVNEYNWTRKGVPWGEGGVNGYPDLKAIIYNGGKGRGNSGNMAGHPHDIYGRYQRMRRLNEGLHEQYPKFTLPRTLDANTLRIMANPYNYNGQYDRRHNIIRHLNSYPAGDEVVPVTLDEFSRGVRRYPETLLDENLEYFNRPTHDELNAKAWENSKAYSDKISNKITPEPVNTPPEKLREMQNTPSQARGTYYTVPNKEVAAIERAWKYEPPLDGVYIRPQNWDESGRNFNVDRYAREHGIKPHKPSSLDLSRLYSVATVPFGMAMAGQDPMMNTAAGLGMMGANVINGLADVSMIAQPFIDAYDYVQSPEYINGRINQMEDID